MGVGAGVLSERARIFVGLDLGQSQDPTALSIVERAEVFPGEMDWVSYERRRPLRFRVLYLERMLLGTPYPRVLERDGRSNTPRSMISLLPGDVTSAATVHQHTLAS